MLKLNSHDLLSSLSLAIDLCEYATFNEDINKKNDFGGSTFQHKFLNHSKRTTYIAMKIGQKISKDKTFLKNLFIASSLHDIGITGTGELIEAHLRSEFILKHSNNGSILIDKLPLDKTISEAVKFHHENYNGTGPFMLKGDEIPLISQIIRVSDAFELMYDENIPNFVQRQFILEHIKSSKGNLFSPFIVDLLLDVQAKDYFWWDIENIGNFQEIFDSIKPEIISTFTLEELRQMSYVFAEIIDKKSPFTYEHSTNLTKLVLKIADYLCFDKEKRVKFEIAALLHDAGKLAIPNSILNKNGSLTDKEVKIIKSHTYYTRLILSKIKGLEDITNWAANHHEKLNGSGYPLGLDKDKLSIEERIMAVCDIYEALTADRPYRKGLDKDRAISIIQSMVDKGEICSTALKYLKETI
ncbi:MAG: HD domain-containing protein [Caloramator sp.]|nr:HD domain-containing protein [Caloramator sp.]